MMRARSVFWGHAMALPRKPKWVVVPDPPPLGDVLHVTRVKATGRPSGIIITPTMWGSYTHFMEWRTRRCVGLENGCAGCKLHIAKRWIGFVQWVDSEFTLHCALELTEKAGNRMKAIREKYGTLRGLRIEVRRERNDKRSPIEIEVLGQHPNPDELPQPKPIEPTLERLWGYLA